MARRTVTRSPRFTLSSIFFLLSCEGSLPSPAAAAGLRSRWALRTEQRNVIAVVLADELHHLGHTGAGIADEGLRLVPLAGRLLGILIDDLVEDVLGIDARQ